MSDPFLGEIRIWACAFAPYGWAFCDGQLLPIAQNTALFSLLGNSFGGDARTTFGLPSLQGRAPMQWGQSPGGGQYALGELGGTPAVALTEQQVPPHAHGLQASVQVATLNGPSPSSSLARSTPVYIYKQPSGAGTPQPLSQGAVSPAGGNLPHNNMMPYQTLNFCIATAGIYPSRP